jgi:uncharacterized protein (TIGR03663 family)
MSKSRSRKQNRAVPQTENRISAAAVAVADAPVMEPVVVSEPTVSEPAPVTLNVVAQWFTLEVVAYGAIGIVAVLLRVMNLDARPLSPEEAKTAAAAWAFLQGQPVGEFSSPLLFTLDWVAFLLFGAFDLTARLLPAALSALIVFVPLLARDALGRTGAIVAALLIAISPTLVFFGRHLGASDLAVGGMMAALILFWNFRASHNTRELYLAAVLAALALTAGATAFSLLIGGALYFVFAMLWARRGATETENVAEAPDETLMHNPYARAALLFALTYILAATTFLLNRDGMGAAFNLFGVWLTTVSGIGSLTTPLNFLLVYEPLALIFGLAGVVLVFSYRGEQARGLDVLRMLAIAALFAFVWYTAGAHKAPGNATAIVLPLILLAGWFIGNLLERAYADVRASGGSGALMTGEIPIFLMLLLLTVLVYLQAGAFLQQTRFSPALDAFYRVLVGDSSEASMVAAFATLALITIFLLAVFVGLSIVLVGIGRTATLLALAVCAILLLGQVRAMWLLNFDTNEPQREILATTQTPRHMRTLVRDLEWYSQLRHGDAHVMRIAADEKLGAVGRWYLRDFPNLIWTNQIERAADAQAIVSPAATPPPGNWMGQRYRTQNTWSLDNANGLDVWKWFVFRQGGAETNETILLWLPTENQ